MLRSLRGANEAVYELSRLRRERRTVGQRTGGNVVIRRLQGLTVLLACLPKDGRCREMFELALALDHEPVVSRLTPPGEPDPSRGHQPWLESIWARSDLSPQERQLVERQNDHEYMEGAIREMSFVQEAFSRLMSLT